MSGLRLLYARFQLDSLEAAESFMVDFGLQPVRRTTERLYMRGCGDAPWLYGAEAGPENKFLGIGFEMERAEDLDLLATLEGSGPVEPIEEPGGGRRVRMIMLDGFEIDAVHGFDTSELLRSREPIALNTARAKPRTNQSVRLKRGIAPVNKFGHVVLHVCDHDRNVAWLQERLGMVASDYMAIPDAPDRPIGSFLRFSRGRELVDHHCLLVLQAPKPAMHHISFELNDMDAVMTSHDYLMTRGYKLDVGVGRHLLGSQIFDYWRDPFGFRVEHYSDGDVVNDDHEPTTFTGSAAETTQWGAEPPAEFFR
jgi:catechol 2,3-dioxygenase-like lactoylglutathione lyase family enzyme